MIADRAGGWVAMTWQVVGEGSSILFLGEAITIITVDMVIDWRSVGIIYEYKPNYRINV